MKNLVTLFPLLAIVASLSAKPESWPVYAFQNGVHFKTTAERVKALKELGYDGIGSAKLSQSDLPLPQRLKLYDEAGLKLFSFYIGGRLGANGHSYGKEISQAIKQLKGRDTILELFVQGNKKSNTDEQAVAFVREIADQAKESGLRIVLYPHAGFYVDTLGGAVRVARKCQAGKRGRHVQPVPLPEGRAEDRPQDRPHRGQAPALAGQHQRSQKKEASSWGQLIQTLDRGRLRPSRPFSKCSANSVSKGNVGFQCYAIRGDSRDNLKRSIGAWNKLHSK